MHETLSLQHDGLLLTAFAQGPVDGPVVFLVHGFPDTPHGWHAVADQLAQRGYRVVRPWLRGYTAESVNPSANYDPYTAGLDLLAWREVFAGQTVHLVGHDWGAVAGMAAVGTNAGAWASLSLLAIPPFQRVERAWRLLPRQVRMSAYMLEMQAANAPSKITARDCARLRTLWEVWSPGWAFSSEQFRPVQQAFETPGVAWAATRYYRSLFTVHRKNTRQIYALSRQPLAVPAQVLVGEFDGCMQAGLVQYMVEPACFPQGVAVHTVSGCGHFLQAEKPDEVADALLKHFQHSIA